MIDGSPDTAWQPRDRPPRKHRRNLRPLLLLVALAVVFAFGIAFGEAIHDNPKPSGPVTTEQTVTPKLVPIHP